MLFSRGGHEDLTGKSFSISQPLKKYLFLTFVVGFGDNITDGGGMWEYVVVFNVASFWNDPTRSNDITVNFATGHIRLHFTSETTFIVDEYTVDTTKQPFREIHGFFSYRN